MLSYVLASCQLSYCDPKRDRQHVPEEGVNRLYPISRVCYEWKPNMFTIS
jgi:hypothetical protein